MSDLINIILNILTFFIALVFAIFYIKNKNKEIELKKEKLKLEENVLKLKYVDTGLGVFTYRYYIDNASVLDNKYCLMVDIIGLSKANEISMAYGDRKILNNIKILIRNLTTQIICRKNTSGDEFMIFGDSKKSLEVYLKHILTDGAEIHHGIGKDVLEAESNMILNKNKK